MTQRIWAEANPLTHSLLIARNRSDQHVAVIDRETALHVAVGLTAGVCGTSVTAAVLATIGLEFMYLAHQQGARRAAFARVVPASSLANHAADVVATVAGYHVGQSLASWWRR